MQVKFSIKRIRIPLVLKADYSQRTLWCWENQISTTSSAKINQSNGWPFKSPVCTAHWTLNEHKNDYDDEHKDDKGRNYKYEYENDDEHKNDYNDKKTTMTKTKNKTIMKKMAMTTKKTNTKTNAKMKTKMTT